MAGIKPVDVLPENVELPSARHGLLKSLPRQPRRHLSARTTIGVLPYKLGVGEVKCKSNVRKRKILGGLIQPNRTSGSKGSLSVHRKLSVQCCPSVTALWHKTDHLKSVKKKGQTKTSDNDQRFGKGCLASPDLKSILLEPFQCWAAA